MLYQKNDKEFQINQENFDDFFNFSNKKNKFSKIRSLSLKSDNSTQICQKRQSLFGNSTHDYSNKKNFINQKKTEIQVKINTLEQKILQLPKSNQQKEIGIVLKKQELIQKLIEDFTSNFEEKIQLEKSLWEIKQSINNYKKQIQFFNTNKNNKKKIVLLNCIQENQGIQDKIQNSLNINQTQQEFFQSFLYQIPIYLQKVNLQQQMNYNYTQLEQLNTQHELLKCQNTIQKQKIIIQNINNELKQKDSIIDCFIKLTNKEFRSKNQLQNLSQYDQEDESNLICNKQWSFTNLVNSNIQKNSNNFSFVKSPNNNTNVKKKFSLDHTKLQNFTLKINQQSEQSEEEAKNTKKQNKYDCINVSELISKNQEKLKQKKTKVEEETINVSNTLKGQKENSLKNSDYKKYENDDDMENFLCTEENEKINDSIIQTPVENDTLQKIESPEKFINGKLRDQKFSKQKCDFPQLSQELFCSIDYK